VKAQISEAFICAGFDAVLLKGPLLVNLEFFTSVMMHYHGNRKVVNLLEQLTELSKAQVMLGIKSR